MELGDGAQPLAFEPEYRAAAVYFLVDGVPMGHRFLNSAELPLTAEQMWEIATEAILPALTQYLVRNRPEGQLLNEFVALDPLDEFRRRRPQSSVPVDRVSVVICTRERPAALSRCLASMRRLRAQPLEILVIDNAPTTDATRLAVAEFPEVRYKLQPRRGLSHARNTGIAASRGEIIAFTDDDVEVTESWLDELIRPFADGDVMCVTGLVIPAEMQTPQQAMFEEWLPFHRGYLPLRFGIEWLRSFRKAPPVWDIGAGANMAIRRSAFEAVGPFDTRLGAGASGCSEDSELWYRLLAGGHIIEYSPSSMVLHYHRADEQSLAQQMKFYSRGHASALIIQFLRYGHRGNLRRLFAVLPSYLLRKLLGSIVFSEWWPYWKASAIGFISGLFYLIGNRKSQARVVSSRSVETHAPVPLLSGGESHGER